LHLHLLPFSSQATKGFTYVLQRLQRIIPEAEGFITGTPSESELEGDGARGRIKPPMGSLEAEAREEEVGILFTVMRRN
jgi:hypothetical protein